MGFEELKFLNTDFQGDPVNCIVYINSIESAGKKSYVLDERNQNLWRELISNSVAVFKVFSIHKIIYDRLTSADVDYMIKHNSRLGTALNNYYGSEIVKAGNIDKVLSTITQDKLNSLEPKFREGIIRYFSGKLSVEGAPAWLAELYDQPELASYDTVETMCGTQDALDIIYKNKALMDALAVYGDFLKPVAASADLMADLVKDDPERAKTLDEIEKSDAWMHTILEDNVGLGKFIAHKSGFALTIYSNFDDMVNTTSVMNTLVANAGVLAYVQRSDLGTAKTLKWRVKRDGRTVNSMDDVFSDTELVTTIADSNGTSTDAMAILVESAPGMQVLIANDEIAEVALGTLSAANNGTAHALVTTDAGVARFDDTENYPDLYTQIFDSADRMEYLMNNEETATAIFKVPKFVKYIGESEVAMTALLASPLAIRCLDDVDEGKKLLLDCDLAAEKLVSNKYTFNYITGRPRWAHYVAYSYPMMSNIVTDYTKISPILEDEGWLSVMKDSWLALDSIMNNAASIRAFKDVIDDNNSFVDMFIESDTLTKYLTNMTSIFGSDTIVSEMSNDNTLLKVVTNSTSAMSSIMDSAVGMVSVSDSVSAMHAIANSKILVRSLIASETAFMSVIYSETAMKEIAASEIAMELIAANGTRMVNVAASSVAVNAVIASKDVALATCVASSTAMTALAASSVAMNAVAASSVAMNAVAASSVAMNAVAASSVAMNAVAASSVAVNAVIASKDVALATCVASSTAMTALAASSVAMNAVAASSVAVNAVIASKDVALAACVASSTAMKELAASSTAMNLIAASSVATNAIIANSTALKIMCDSSTAMKEVCANSSCMNIIAASSVARDAIVASSVAYKAVTDSSMAVAKFAVGAAGLSPADYSDMSVVAASSVATNAIIANSTALKIMCDSSTAMKEVCANSSCMNIIAASSVAMNAVAASSVAVGAIASSTTAQNAVLASSTALSALDASSLAKTMSTAGTVTGKGFVISYSVQSNVGSYSRSSGGYTVTIDSTNVAYKASGTGSDNSQSNMTANGSHLFFTSKIALAFTTGTETYGSATGSGSMKYILGS